MHTIDQAIQLSNLIETWLNSHEGEDVICWKDIAISMKTEYNIDMNEESCIALWKLLTLDFSSTNDSSIQVGDLI
jgi:hypothetical protein